MMVNRYPLENDWKVEEIEITLASQPGFNMLISKSSKFVIDEWTWIYEWSELILSIIWLKFWLNKANW